MHHHHSDGGIFDICLLVINCVQCCIMCVDCAAENSVNSHQGAMARTETTTVYTTNGQIPAQVNAVPYQQQPNISFSYPAAFPGQSMYTSQPPQPNVLYSYPTAFPGQSTHTSQPPQPNVLYSYPTAFPGQSTHTSQPPATGVERTTPDAPPSYEEVHNEDKAPIQPIAPDNVTAR